jgi:protein-L-isoaspartate(D-aspartate) O-methyltransferase
VPSNDLPTDPSPGPSAAAVALVRDIARDVTDQRVLRAMLEVPRERFVPPEVRPYAYENEPLPIGDGQTISQPLIVAMMSEALALDGSERVLEVGTGSGYQAAILGRLAREVVSVEVRDVLRERAEVVLRDLGVTNVLCLPAGDTLGAPERAPYDGIIVAAAAPRVPASLVAQLKVGGRIVIPVGTRTEQQLVMVLLREDGSLDERSLGACRFVPLVGSEGLTVTHSP